MKMMSYQKLKVTSLILLSKNEEISKKRWGQRIFSITGVLMKRVRKNKKGGVQSPLHTVVSY